MAENSGIQWTDHTFNPWSGCEKIVPECANCYAAVNYSVKMRGVEWGSEKQGGNRKVAAASTWRDPDKWNRQAEAAGSRQRVFCASLADIGEDWRGPMLNSKGERLYCYDDYIRTEGDVRVRDLYEPATMDDVRDKMLWPKIRATTWLDWMMLSKRPERFPAILPPGFWPNVWLGTSAGCQASVERFLPELVAMRGRVPVLFLSCEPLLERVVIDPELLELLDLVIIGGESGPKSRDCDVSWIRELITQCKRYQVCVFVKQLGARAFELAGKDGNKANGWMIRPGGVKHPKGGDLSEWPEDLQVRELPILPEGLYA